MPQFGEGTLSTHTRGAFNRGEGSRVGWDREEKHGAPRAKRPSDYALGLKRGHSPVVSAREAGINLKKDTSSVIRS